MTDLPEESDDSTEVQSVSKMSKRLKKSWAGQAFTALDTENRGYLLKHELLDHFHHSGVYTHHGLAGLIAYLEAKSHKCPITFEEFNEFSAKDNFVKRVLENNLIIPQYINVRKVLHEAFNEIKEDREQKYNYGKVATYIPELASADPNWFATAFCSTDSQFTQLGDCDKMFSIQSISKVVSYAMLYNIYESQGKTEELHKWVGEEPSGVAFNAPVFDKKGRPHNPMVNAGAILVSTLLCNEGVKVKDYQDFFKRATCASRADIDLPLY